VLDIGELLVIAKNLMKNTGTGDIEMKRSITTRKSTETGERFDSDPDNLANSMTFSEQL
jgi:hypothetical protein